MIAVLIVFLAANEKRNLTKKNQNETENRQIRDSVTVSNLKARKINTSLLLQIDQARRRYAAASIFVLDPLDASSIHRQHIRCSCCSLCAHIPPPIPTLLL